jgi:hypothetical protein
MTRARAHAADFELTVVGRIGPVLRAMLEPVAATTSCEVQTVLCLQCRDGEDVPDVVELLESRGLVATMVRPID